MKNIFLVPNIKKDTDYVVTRAVAQKLLSLELCVTMLSLYRESHIENCVYVEDIPKSADLVLVIGGDGSFIDAAGFAIKNDVPILGINLGKVGYLSEIEPTDLSPLEKLKCDEYSIDNKMLLEVCSERDEGKLKEKLAVNDIVLSHPSYLGISDFVLISKEGGVRYRADGIVVSTPAGSTAYSLSAGGPIVSHGASAIIVTPIAPHSFFNRSIVFGENEIIKIKNTSSEALNLSLDGRFCHVLAPSEKCTVKASEKRLKVLTFKENNMFSNLFCKMQIMEDII